MTQFWHQSVGWSSRAAKVVQLPGDTISVSAYGKYPQADPEVLQPLHGHSKYHRPDLKQLRQITPDLAGTTLVNTSKFSDAWTLELAHTRVVHRVNLGPRGSTISEG